MNIVIIEDEQLTLEDLTGIIKRIDPAIKIVAMLESVRAAVAWFNGSPPVDLIFSDIQLGDGLSFEIFRRSSVTAPIIFCTAYDEYSLEAIRNNGIEYILKPFDRQAIAAAIEKYRRLKHHFVPKNIDFDKLLLAIAGEKEPRSNSILVYHRDKIIPIPFKEVALFYVQDELIRIQCFNGTSYSVSQPLDDIEALAGPQFFRINRQVLVNRQAVKDANHYEHRKYVVNLSVIFKEILVVSKNRTGNFLEWLKT